MTKLKTKEIKEWRNKLLKLQKGKCKLCGLELLEEEAVLDHDHVTGHIRAALHSGCNRAEGKAINWIYRTKSNDPVAFAKALAKLWDKDYSKLPLHPTHKTDDEKRIAKNLKAKNRRNKLNKKRTK